MAALGLAFGQPAVDELRLLECLALLARRDEQHVRRYSGALHRALSLTGLPVNPLVGDDVGDARTDRGLDPLTQRIQQTPANPYGVVPRRRSDRRGQIFFIRPLGSGFGLAEHVPAPYNLVGGLVDGQPVGVDGPVGQSIVELPLGFQGTYCRQRVGPGEHRPDHRLAAPSPLRFEPLVDGLGTGLEANDDAVALHGLAIAAVLGDATAGGDHLSLASGRRRQALALQPPKGRLAIGVEYPLDGLARAGRDQLVGVQESPTKAAGNLMADTGLTRTGEPGYEDVGFHDFLAIRV